MEVNPSYARYYEELELQESRKASMRRDDNYLADYQKEKIRLMAVYLKKMNLVMLSRAYNTWLAAAEALGSTKLTLRL